jgi:hypothetical protein
MNQFISLQQAIDINSRFRANKENVLANAYKNQKILPVCESFDKSAINDLLAQSDCSGIRIYFSMGIDYKVKVTIVGFDSNEKDILPTNEELIVEEGKRCPDDCPPSSPLNS